MQTFIDSHTQGIWAFEDDVVVTETNDVYSFTTAAGLLLTTPASLQPYTPPETTVTPPTLDQIKQGLCDSIDAAVAAIYANFNRFQQEYLNRESAAGAFKAAGYTGDPGLYVTGYATAANLTNQAAADAILAQADILNTALANLGAQRMRKYAVSGAADEATAQEICTEILTQIQSIAAELS